MQGDPATLPQLAWQFVVIQVSEQDRVIDPVLAFGRDQTIYFYQVICAGPVDIRVSGLQKIQLPYKLLSLAVSCGSSFYTSVGPLPCCLGAPWYSAMEAENKNPLQKTKTELPKVLSLILKPGVGQNAAWRDSPALSSAVFLISAFVIHLTSSFFQMVLRYKVMFKVNGEITYNSP